MLDFICIYPVELRNQKQQIKKKNVCLNRISNQQPIAFLASTLYHWTSLTNKELLYININRLIFVKIRNDNGYFTYQSCPRRSNLKLHSPASAWRWPSRHGPLPSLTTSIRPDRPRNGRLSIRYKTSRWTPGPYLWKEKKYLSNDTLVLEKNISSGSTDMLHFHIQEYTCPGVLKVHSCAQTWYLSILKCDSIVVVHSSIWTLCIPKCAYCAHKACFTLKHFDLYNHRNMYLHNARASTDKTLWTCACALNRKNVAEQRIGWNRKHTCIFKFQRTV